MASCSSHVLHARVQATQLSPYPPSPYGKCDSWASFNLFCCSASWLRNRPQRLILIVGASHGSIGQSWTVHQSAVDNRKSYDGLSSFMALQNASQISCCQNRSLGFRRRRFFASKRSCCAKRLNTRSPANARNSVRACSGDIIQSDNDTHHRAREVDVPLSRRPGRVLRCM